MKRPKQTAKKKQSPPLTPAKIRLLLRWLTARVDRLEARLADLEARGE